jgi:hypothetical protein
MPQDMLDLLRLDSGTRTMGQLMQEREREWAYGEITRLRRENAPQHRGTTYAACARTRFGPDAG